MIAMGMTIREARKQDWPEIREMMAELHKFEGRYDPRYSFDSGTGRAWALWVKYALKRNKGRLVVAEYKNNLVGFACGWIEKKPASLFKGGRQGYFLDLFVKPKHRKRGIGRRLAQEILGFFHKAGVKTVNIDTHLANKTSQKLYQSLGFRKITVAMFKQF